MPTCDSTADCIGGQECVDIMSFTALCLSSCESNADCGGQECEEVGAMGMVLANVCACSNDNDCGTGLLCCEIPYVNVNTCLTSCIDNLF